MRKFIFLVQFGRQRQNRQFWVFTFFTEKMPPVHGLVCFSGSVLAFFAAFRFTLAACSAIGEFDELIEFCGRGGDVRLKVVGAADAETPFGDVGCTTGIKLG